MTIYLLKIDFLFSVLFLPLLHLLIRRKERLEVTHLMRNDMATTPHSREPPTCSTHCIALLQVNTLYLLRVFIPSRVPQVKSLSLFMKDTRCVSFFYSCKHISSQLFCLGVERHYRFKSWLSPFLLAAYIGQVISSPGSSVFSTFHLSNVADKNINLI